MAAALRAAEGEGIFFPNPQGGILKIFPARGYTPLPPPIPDPCIKPILIWMVDSSIKINNIFALIW